MLFLLLFTLVQLYYSQQYTSIINANASINQDAANIIINNNITQSEKSSAAKIPKTIVYWGQNSYGAAHLNTPELWEKPLKEYCDNSIDAIVLSFLHIFNVDSDKPPEINLSYHCNTTFENTNLLRCPEIEKDIIYCQSRGVRLLLSLGGASGAYGFSNVQQANKFSKTIWDMFLGGSSKLRPFGAAVLDGIDLDIEGGSSLGYAELVHSMRELYVKYVNKKFYIAAAPQCVYPDAFLKQAMEQAWFDWIFIQFYNNYCGIHNFPNAFNYNQWDEWANKISINPNVRLYLGVPGSATAANIGYLGIDKLSPILTSLIKYKSFGGVMIWDASQSDSKSKNEIGFAKAISDFLNKKILKEEDKIQQHEDIQEEENEDNKSITQIKQYNNKVDLYSYSFQLKYPVLDQMIQDISQPCQNYSISCYSNSYVICLNNKWIEQTCPSNLTCFQSLLKQGVPCHPTKFKFSNTHFNVEYFKLDNENTFLFNVRNNDGKEQVQFCLKDNVIMNSNLGTFNSNCIRFNTHDKMSIKLKLSLMNDKVHIIDDNLL